MTRIPIRAHQLDGAVKRTVQEHGCQVFAESDGHTGATFGFTLPR